MSFSQTELINTLRLLSTRLPSFSEPQMRVNRLLRMVTEQLSGHLNEQLKEFGVNENLWFALLVVYVSPDGQILPSRLSDLMGLTRTSATRLSDEMVARNWVARHINQQDRRQIVLELTAEGEAFIQKVWPQVEQASGKAWEHFTSEDFSQLQHLLLKLLQGLES